ncbi:MAG: permease [Streptococcaceae bacterium]|jgi:uncharacterized membrane protein YraQ (UPF0718 family)|nr:permease [Streptococcaceae bacterium]
MLQGVFPDSVLQMGTIFLSIIIEALPFVLFGCFVAGILHVYLTPERVQKLLPKNKFGSILVGSCIGFFFPSCECGIVPIVHKFIEKKVPPHTAFAFMMTAPIINPVVIFSTYIAFGNTFKFAALRVLGAFLVSILVSSWIAYLYKGKILKTCSPKEEKEPHGHFHTHDHPHDELENQTAFQKIVSVLDHAIEEFFDTGRYLIFGSLIASAMQTYLPTKFLYSVTQEKFLAIFLLLVLAFVLSLCSEADAFIGSSLLSLFGTAPIAAFLIFGPMVDVKNILLMKRFFHTKFIVKMMTLIFLTTFIFALFL